MTYFVSSCLSFFIHGFFILIAVLSFSKSNPIIKGKSHQFQILLVEKASRQLNEFPSQIPSAATKAVRTKTIKKTDAALAVTTVQPPPLGESATLLSFPSMPSATRGQENAFLRIKPDPNNIQPSYPDGQCLKNLPTIYVTFALKRDGTVKALSIEKGLVPNTLEEALKKVLLSWRFMIEGETDQTTLYVKLPIEYICETSIDSF